ncbi:olfactory receptor 5G29-like [Anomaloglossus baeobatrachus]
MRKGEKQPVELSLPTTTSYPPLLWTFGARNRAGRRNYTTSIGPLTSRRLQFCGSNVIDHFFCDVAPLLELSCSDTSIVKIEIYVCSIPIVLFPFLFIMGSYISIFLSIVRISSTSGRQKAFSTCSSHLTVVSLYYGTLFAVYVIPSSVSSLNLNKILSLLYTVVTPMFNPIIYSLRNQEIKNTIEVQVFGRHGRY